MEWSFKNDLPIYAQLVEKFRQAIAAGELPPGTRLPGVRELAAEAGVNPNTMQRAMQELEREGFVYTQRTAGRFVTEDEAAVGSLKSAMAEGLVRSFLAEMGKLGYGRRDILALLQEEKEENWYANPGV